MGPGPIELLARARAGQAEALGELCALYRNYLRMVVRTGLGPRLRERVELSDVVQEALVEVVRQFPQFTGQNEAALVGWLRRLVGQKLADLGRYHSRAKRGAGGSALPLDAPWDVPGGADSAGGGAAACSTAWPWTRPARARRPAAAS
jgi:RNA polymerase sigma-70 factor (ECF subfamily)